MQGIEEKIKRNIASFNEEEPGKDHLKNFSDKLDNFHSGDEDTFLEKYGFILKIAAGVLLFVTVGILYYSNTFDKLRDEISDQIVAAELPVELIEVMEYYNVITDRKVQQIDELAVSADEATRIKQMALLELKNLADHRSELEEEYAKYPDNERILNALLLNQQKRTAILDKIINTLSQVN